MTSDSEGLDISAPPAASGRPQRRMWPWMLAAAVAVLLIHNLTVWAPVATVLDQDERNDVAGVHVYRSWLVHPRNITVDLVTVGDAAPVDLARLLFQTSEALKDREFGRVIIARQGKPVFMMEGSAFAQLGQDYAAGENPIYLIRTLPEQIFNLDGTAAFGTWTGGLFGVLGKQLEDVNAFGEAWVTGEPGS